MRPGFRASITTFPTRSPGASTWRVYLLTKGIAAGALFLSAMLWWLGWRDPITNVVGPAIAVVFGTVTAVVLIADLERPERFYYILIRPNWRSWMVWGAYFLTAHGAIAALWLLAAGSAPTGCSPGSSCRRSLRQSSRRPTGFLFAQGLARDLWQGPYAAVDLLAQAAAAGAARSSSRRVSSTE